MLTFSEKLLSSYLPLQIPRVNPKQARAYHRKPAISSFCQIATAERKAGHCAQRTRSICATCQVQCPGRHRLDDLAESHVLPQDSDAGKPQGAKTALWAYWVGPQLGVGPPRN